MKIVWSDRSRTDLRLIEEYIARDSADAARKFIEKLVNATEILITAPKTGRKVPEINIDYIRELIIGNYRIVYSIQEDRINIVTVFEGHKMLQ